MMNNQEVIHRSRLIIEKNQVFENLSSNPDFITWRDEKVLGRLEEIKTAILSVDRKSPDWKEAVCDGIVAYQEALLTYQTLFEASARLVEATRKNIEKLTEAQG
jgi:hypothetical protein